MGLLRPTEGRAEILGLNTWSQSTEVRASVGYLPGDVRFRERQTGRQILRLFAKLRAVPNGYDALAERLGLDLDRAVRAYSKGMKQKLGLIQALMHYPKIIVLDEPTSGLDPFTQKQVNELLRERREAGATVFFSSHVLPEVEEMCDRIALLQEGRLLRCAALHELRELRQRRFELPLPTVSEAKTVFSRVLGSGIRVEIVERTLVGYTQDVGKLLDLLHGLDLNGLKLEGLRLEDLFYELYDTSRSPEVVRDA